MDEAIAESIIFGIILFLPHDDTNIYRGVLKANAFTRQQILHILHKEEIW